jgi:nicotinamide-nucleotide amidase
MPGAPVQAGLAIEQARAMLPDSTLTEAESLLAACRARGVMLATAESCTGGLIAAALTAIAGSSDVVDRGFVTYSNEAKNELIGVPMPLIHAHGAVSEDVARAMAQGALDRSRAGIAVSVTGVAGPGGGSAEKPVGLVCFGLAQKGAPVISRRQIFPGDRTAIRAETVRYAFVLIREALASST